MNTMKLYKFHIHEYPEITHGIQVENIRMLLLFQQLYSSCANMEENKKCMILEWIQC